MNNLLDKIVSIRWENVGIATVSITCLLVVAPALYVIILLIRKLD